MNQPRYNKNRSEFGQLFPQYICLTFILSEITKQTNVRDTSLFTFELSFFILLELRFYLLSKLIGNLYLVYRIIY